MTTDGDRCQYETCRDVQRSNAVSRDDLSRLLRRAIVDCSSDNRRRKQGDAPGAEYCELCNLACKLHALCLVRPEHMMEGSDAGLKHRLVLLRESDA